ncbi:glycosyltransferase family 31 protein [Gonapodya prolifera JEL478]|uniref:N-acetylgalactosaminide beta-1,3-galactosyltransferase n=1 Tax=Gonapodya prolifera (strain JEL478) TaxID=1344416 RepID=A0A139AZB5_GONPJ|nr:glycosyltransferase family 31 protein [Gonapodya prolifera JEL478]|eukprot:KXS22059.1 glycosyltransferase family 31 protein [Gonapodya prolifera JEL478]
MPERFICSRRYLVISNVASLLAITLLLLSINRAPERALTRELRTSSPFRDGVHQPTTQHPIRVQPDVQSESEIGTLVPPPTPQAPLKPRHHLIISVLASAKHIARALAVQATWKDIAARVSGRAEFGWTVDVRFVLGKGALDQIVREHSAVKEEDASSGEVRIKFQADKLPKDFTLDEIPNRMKRKDPTMKPAPIFSGVVEADVEDSEGSAVTNRVMWTWSWMHRTFPTHDFYMKCDDDTFVVVENLIRYLDLQLNSGTDASRGPMYLGRVLKFPYAGGQMLPFASGGAGYLLNRAALDTLTNHPTHPISTCMPSHHAKPYDTNPGEDVAMAFCLTRLGIHPSDVAGMYYAQPEGVIRVSGGGQGFGDERGLETWPISWHWLQQAGRMGEMEWLLYGARVWDGSAESTQTYEVSEL